MNNFTHQLSSCDHRLLSIPLLLSLTGIAGLASITSSSGTFLSREVLIQSAALICGIAAAFVILYLGYRYFISLEKPLYAAGIALLLSVYIPGLGITVSGSRAWIDAGVITVQPSEIVKILFIILMASFLSRSTSSLNSAGGISKAVFYSLPFIVIVSKEDFGSGCVFCVIWLFMVFCSGLELRIIGRLVLALVAVMPLFYFFLAGYQKERIDAFFSPDDLDLPGTYQVWNSRIAIGSGGFLGKGYMHGTHTALGFLPVPESDFIFSAITEESGFIGGLMIILLFAGFVYCALRVTRYASELQGTLTGAGLVGMFSFQAFENIGMTMGVMPVTGIPLPFLSCGGTAMVSSMMGVGLLLSISCSQKI